jgi:hypothetical protein
MPKKRDISVGKVFIKQKLQSPLYGIRLALAFDHLLAGKFI